MTLTLRDPGHVDATAQPKAPARPATEAVGSALVRLCDVRKRFGGMPALDGISFEVRAGEVLGIIGRSGAGKSTLIRCLNGLERPDAGSVEVLGQQITDLREASLRRLRARIGMIFQHFNLLSAKTVAANVALPLKIAGAPKAKRHARVQDLLHLVGLEGRGEHYPAQLSGGQKQRVGIARALAADPALLLSDEATSALDPETTASILALLRDINRQLGLTVVMITHEMSVVRAIADRIVVLDRGRVVEAGRTANLFAAPEAELTRRLIAAAHHAPDDRTGIDLEPGYRPGLHAVLRVAIRGEAATSPAVGLITQAAGVEPLVLRAEIDRVAAEPVATLVLAVPDASPERLAQLRRASPLALWTIEVIGYASHPV